MPKLDGLKEDIGVIKFWLGVSVAVFTAITGWIANNYKQAEFWLLCAGAGVLLLLVIAIYLLNSAMLKKAKEIKDA